MKKFRYKVIKRTLDELMSDYQMDNYGLSGWELSAFSIGVRHAVYIFKKRLQNNSNHERSELRKPLVIQRAFFSVLYILYETKI